MNLVEYAKKAKETCLPQCLNTDYLSLGLIDEIGEIAGKLKRVERENKQVDRIDILKELGDILWYIAMLTIINRYEYILGYKIDTIPKLSPKSCLLKISKNANKYIDKGLGSRLFPLLEYMAAFARFYGSTLEEVADMNIEKLTARKEKGMLTGTGDNREKEIWKHHPEQCELCGSSSEIYTCSSTPEGFGYDGDQLRCTECGATGSWSVYAEDDAFCNWNHDTGNSRELEDKEY